MVKILIPIIALITLNVSAHSGRTNASGCHGGKKQYHCHGGYSSSLNKSYSNKDIEQIKAKLAIKQKELDALSGVVKTKQSHSESKVSTTTKNQASSVKMKSVEQIIVAEKPINKASSKLKADSNILLAQEKLRDLGYYKGEMNGIETNQMTRAVIQFQIENGMIRDGILSNELLDKLNKKK